MNELTLKLTKINKISLSIMSDIITQIYEYDKDIQITGITVSPFTDSRIYLISKHFTEPNLTATYENGKIVWPKKLSDNNPQMNFDFVNDKYDIAGLWTNLKEDIKKTYNCEHDFAEYKSLFNHKENFYYCKKCDIRADKNKLYMFNLSTDL